MDRDYVDPCFQNAAQWFLDELENLGKFNASDLNYLCELSRTGRGRF